MLNGKALSIPDQCVCPWLFNWGVTIFVGEMIWGEAASIHQCNPSELLHEAWPQLWGNYGILWWCRQFHEVYQTISDYIRLYQTSNPHDIRILHITDRHTGFSAWLSTLLQAVRTLAPGRWADGFLALSCTIKYRCTASAWSNWIMFW